MNNLIEKGSLDITKIYNDLELFCVVGYINENSLIIDDKNYLDNLKEKWIISKVKMEINHPDNTIKILNSEFIYNNFENSIIKNFIMVTKIDNEKNTNTFLIFLKKSK